MNATDEVIMLLRSIVTLLSDMNDKLDRLEVRSAADDASKKPSRKPFCLLLTHGERHLSGVRLNLGGNWVSVRLTCRL